MTLEEAINKYAPPDDPNGMIDLDVFDHYNVVTGTTGSGKSTHVRENIVPFYNGVKLWILDPKFQFGNCGKIVYSVNELQEDYQCVLQPDDQSESMFRKFCKRLLDTTNTHGIIDEIHLWLSKHKVIKEHYDLIMTKRNDGVTTTSISTDPSAIPNYILRTVTHVWSFRYNLESDIDWLKKYIGDKAWFLLPPDKRDAIDTKIPLYDNPKETITFKDMPLLNEYGFVYRDLRRADSAIFGGFRYES